MGVRTNSKLFGAAAIVAGISLSWGCTVSSGDRATVGKVPEVVFGGGAGELSIQMEMNQPSRLKATFSKYDEEGYDERAIEVVEDLKPGSYTRTVELSPETYVYFELGVPEASVGAEAEWVVTLDDQEVYRESDRLTEPLKSGYAFFLQFEADDVDQIRSWIR